MDKIQMMMKVLCYENEQCRNLSELWEYENNCKTYGIPEAKQKNSFRKSKRLPGTSTNSKQMSLAIDNLLPTLPTQIRKLRDE